MSALSAPIMPLHQRALHTLLQLLQQALQHAHAKMPVWLPAASAAFMAGCGMTALYCQYNSRRRWSPQQLRMHRATPLLKEYCRQCWDEVDAEGSGWLEASEARAVLDSLLQALQARSAQLAALVAPPALQPSSEDGASASAPAVADSNSSDPVAAAAAAAVQSSNAPAHADVEAEVRASLSRLWPSLRRNLTRDFKYFLEALEARPAHPPRSFTPPANHRSAASSHAHSPLTAAQRRTSNSGSPLVSGAVAPAAHSPSSAVAAAAAASSDSVGGVAASAASLSSSGASLRSNSTSTRAGVDRRMFRCEFNTAAVIWIESQMLLQLYSNEDRNDGPG